MSIFDKVMAFVNAPEPKLFEPLALEVFCYQAENVPPYRAYLENLGIDHTAVLTLAQIPPVSTVAFKYVCMESIEERGKSASRLFLTSGTAIGPNERGRHFIARPEIYRASAINHLRRMLFPDGRRMAMIALHPTAERMPESSLAQMITWCIEEFGAGGTICAATRECIDTAGAIDFLRQMIRKDEPVCILATTASCAALFATLREKKLTIELHAGSRLMDTGGAKGQVVPLSGNQIVAEAQRMLGIAPALVINEYGMTEMCSQLYDATSFNSDREEPPEQRIKLAPPWLRPIAINPATLTPVEDGQVGLLSFFDLANVGSVSALMTEDFGMVRDGAVAVLGRAAAGDPRGCALAIEEFAIRKGDIRRSI
jgi:hypothetical protein